MKNTSLKNQIAQGFSLVEMLVVIAVIGVIAAIAIPSIGNLNDSAKTAKDQRNAQNVVSVYQAGLAAGVSWDADKTKFVKEVVDGKAPTEGAFKDKKFAVPGLSDDDQKAAAKYIKVDQGIVSYVKEGGQ